MSTFDGNILEFPNICVDYFQNSPDNDFRSRTGFVSHVHTDHTVGLSRFPGFIYCSQTTRDILLKLEIKAIRLSRGRGIIEAPVRHFKGIAKRLRSIPLNVPTEIQTVSTSGRIESLRVTLLDANHCPGAVMFLFENDRGMAVLYTGDIRAEQWFVNSIAKHPSMLPYTRGLRRLTRLYLDTTFASTDERLQDFLSKADGISELLFKISKYPLDTCFHFHYWTFGYEDVWSAMSSFLRTPIHVDAYRYGLFGCSTRNAQHGTGNPELRVLAGYALGNEYVPGILTRDPSVRLHSCEAGGERCSIFDTGRNAVRITPILSRYKNEDIREIGAGGGLDDARQTVVLDLADIEILLEQYRSWEDDEKFHKIVNTYIRQMRDAGKPRLILHINSHEDEEDDPLVASFRSLRKLARDAVGSQENVSKSPEQHQDLLPRKITFPYSRHSSYNELRLFVRALNPLDVYPCTELMDPLTSSIEALFGSDFDVGPLGYQYDASRRKATTPESRTHEKTLSSPAKPSTQKRRYSTISDERSTAKVTENQASYDVNAGTASNDSGSKRAKICPADTIDLGLSNSSTASRKYHVRQMKGDEALQGEWTGLDCAVESQQM